MFHAPAHLGLARRKIHRLMFNNLRKDQPFCSTPSVLSRNGATGAAPSYQSRARTHESVNEPFATEKRIGSAMTYCRGAFVSTRNSANFVATVCRCKKTPGAPSHFSALSALLSGRAQVRVPFSVFLAGHANLHAAMGNLSETALSRRSGFTMKSARKSAAGPTGRARQSRVPGPAPPAAKRGCLPRCRCFLVPHRHSLKIRAFLCA